MMDYKTCGLPAGLALMVATAASAQQSSEQQRSDQECLDALRREIAALRGDSEPWLTEERATEIRAIVHDVLLDSATRSSLQGSGATSGYANGFFLSSSDGAFSMKINLLEQIRWSYNDSNDAAAGGGGGGGGGVAGLGGAGTADGDAYGFENKRTRIGFSGNMVDSTWTYDLKYYLGYSNSVEDFGAGELADASVTKALECGATVTVGQFKLPFSAEYGLDVGSLQFMDYSVIGAAYSAGYGQGLKVGYSTGDLRLSVAYVNLPNTVNQEWDANSPGSDWTLAGRVEGKFAGVWSQFDQAQSWRGDSYGVMVGGGIAAAQFDGGSDATITRYTVDMTVDLGGANIAAAYYGASFEDTGFGALDASNPMGFVVSAGMFVSDTCDVAIRYEYGDADLGAGSDDEFSLLTLGSNWYMARNTAKLGVEFGYAFDAVSALYSATAIGNNLLLDAAGDDGQWVIRTQLSFQF